MNMSKFLIQAMQYFMFLSILLPLSRAVVHNNLTDLEALLAFKAGVRDPNGILSSNWTTNTSICMWIGVSCSHRRQRVVALAMDSITLYGTISPQIANLSFLSKLYLTNNSIWGAIPDTLARMPRLTYLALQENQLSGTIPPAIFNISKLSTVSFTANSLSGTLTLMNYSSPKITELLVSINQLIGCIPSTISHFPNLEALSLSLNNFSGNIPPELGNLQQLQFLYLGSNNLTGTIPTTLGNLTNLLIFDLGGNNVHGIIPKELGGLSNLGRLLLGSNLGITGPIPTSLSNMSSLRVLDVGYNQLIGPIHVQFGNMAYFRTLFLSENNLTGGLEFLTSLSNCKYLRYIDMVWNMLDGTLPTNIGNLSTNLVEFAVYSNRIKGIIPDSICNLSSLEYLALGKNELVWMIPPEIIILKNLQYLDLHSNGIYGSIPYEIGRLRMLSALYLGGNKLSGSIPDSLGNISGLQHLTLSSNSLSSKIPESLWSLAGLIELDLSQNFLTGSLPSGIGNLKSLDSLSVSMNNLSGNITSAFEELQMLTYLDLSKNLFRGLIPPSFEELINIETLNLSCNNLTGIIPNFLVNLRHLRNINLSFNKLEGKIPNGGVFLNITTASLVGNAALCGSYRLGFGPCETNGAFSTSYKTLRLLKYLLPTFASIIIIFLCFYLLVKTLQKRRESPAPINTQFPHNHRLISYQELVRATENFSEANLLGRGSLSFVYRGYLDDGFLVAIKVLHLEIDGASRSFDVECQALRMVRHRNLVKIISTCSNLDFKALVLQFLPNGSLERWLYSHNYFLNLLQRINIVLDIASALEYLHHNHSQVVVHCDLKPSNVLLDEDMTAHVGDFGIAKLLHRDSFTLQSTCPAGTIGYMAPEYASIGRVSEKGDVYSFGILLLEIFTRKKPTDSMFDEELSLRRWVGEAHPTSILEIVDNNLLEGNYGNERPIGDLNSIRAYLSTVIGLGIVCSSDSPEERLAMNQVVPKLQKIKEDYLSKFPDACSTGSISMVSEN